ncbi:MAG TPA: hypothetical protein VFO48_07340, partial [Vicinamibacterales bacterium]|nr:hypothetical protein [Vicinamibacterales bacterium]
SRGTRRVEVTTTLVGGDGKAVFSSREMLSGARVPVTKHIPLKDLRPGNYLLRMEARALDSLATSVARETPVTLLP